MPRINPHVGLFVAVAVLMVALFGWLRSDVAAMGARLEERIVLLEERMTRLEGRMTRLEERMTRLEERMVRIEERIVRLEAGQNALTERVARIEGRIEGVLAFARRGAFPEPGPDSRERAPPQ